jgi:hypothetical protein
VEDEGRVWGMKFHIAIPSLEVILSMGVDIELAPKGSKWSELPLGEQRKEIGVYVIHHKGDIKYVGKTNGKKMSFGMRLRRHFQETAAGEHTYPRWLKIVMPPKIQVSLFSLDRIRERITFEEEIKDPWLVEVIPLFEAALIVALKPVFQDKSERSVGKCHLPTGN